jgi:alpha-N-acetylglucosamine transferase
LDIKYWLYQPEQILVVSLPEEYEEKASYISLLLMSAYDKWALPEENCETEEEVEAIYDADCAPFIMDELYKESGLKLDWTLIDDADERDADYICYGM